jgi:hypothetical protein
VRKLKRITLGALGTVLFASFASAQIPTIVEQKLCRRLRISTTALDSAESAPC